MPSSFIIRLFPTEILTKKQNFAVAESYEFEYGA